MRPNRQTAWLPALLLCALTIPGAPALADRDVVVRDESVALPLQGARSLKIDVPVGEVHVDATDGDQVETRLVVQCNQRSQRCRDRAAGVHLVSKRSDDGLALEISEYGRDGHHGFHHPDLELRLSVPSSLALEIDMGVGELEVEGMEGDVSVDLGVGETRIVMPESAVRSVSIDVGVGEAHLSPPQPETHRQGFLFLGNEVDWKEGAGRARISVDVGVGEASVRLTL